jgi:hypothetical protein
MFAPLNDSFNRDATALAMGPTRAAELVAHGLR